MSWQSFFRIDAGFATTAGTPVTAIARNSDHIDLFVTGSDGGVHSAYWDSASGWSSFFRIDAGFATTAGASVTALKQPRFYFDHHYSSRLIASLPGSCRL